MMKIDVVFGADSFHLSKLLNLKERAEGLWHHEELGSIWCEQLNAPLQFDLTTGDPKTKTKIDTVYSTVSKPPGSFGELFRHQHPPLQLLKLTKDFGRKIADKKNTALPWEIGYLIYFVSIAVALARCGQRITALSAEEMRKGFKWGMKRAWVDEETRLLLQEALEHPNSSP